MYGRERDLSPAGAGTTSGPPCRANFFTVGYLEDRLKAWPAVDPARQKWKGNRQAASGRGAEDGESADRSVEQRGKWIRRRWGAFVPIYEGPSAHLASRMIRRAIYNTLQNLDSSIPDVLPPELLGKVATIPLGREALIHTHFSSG